ncbi:MAG: hypothetical protein H7312_27845 [Tardiphaga sp.]|nr:hypothetical protein [Tardiphaga sp.]
MTSRIEVVGRISERRHWMVGQKPEMLRDTIGPDGWVQTAIERHEVPLRTATESAIDNASCIGSSPWMMRMARAIVIPSPLHSLAAG